MDTTARRRPTIRDVAAAAGVSRGTVSRVLNGGHWVSPEALAAVQEAMELTGTEGCDAWLEAEAGLVANADIVPFALTQARTFGAGAEFAVPGQLQPPSIRMMAE